IETFYLSAMLLVVKFPEEFSKRQDVFRAFPERGYFHGVLTQSEIQVPAETPFRYGFFQILVRCGDDAHVGFPVFCAADRTVSPVLYGAEQHLLYAEGKVAYLIQEQRSSL